jgi:hypothetical protein
MTKMASARAFDSGVTVVAHLGNKGLEIFVFLEGTISVELLTPIFNITNLKFKGVVIPRARDWESRYRTYSWIPGYVFRG